MYFKVDERVDRILSGLSPRREWYVGSYLIVTGALKGKYVQFSSSLHPGSVPYMISIYYFFKGIETAKLKK